MRLYLWLVRTMSCAFLYFEFFPWIPRKILRLIFLKEKENLPFLRSTTNAMRTTFSSGSSMPKFLVEVGYIVPKSLVFPLSDRWKVDSRLLLAPARNEVAHGSMTKLFEVRYGLELESAKPNVLDMASMVGKALYLMASYLLSKSISKWYPSRWSGGSPDLVYLSMIGI